MNQTGRDIKFDMFFIPLSDQAKSTWGDQKFRFYSGRGELFYETIESYSKKFEELNFNIFTEFKIELRDTESGRTDSCIFSDQEQMAY
jgi:hypothetical protein